MQSLRNLALAGATALALAPAAAHGADMPAPPIYKPYVEDYGAWYLRGDIGITNQRVKKLDSPAFDATVNVIEKGFESAGLFGLGIGYKFNNWFRVDATGEYRANSTFHGLDTFPSVAHPGTTSTNLYTGVKSEWLFLLNAFFDLGTWHSVTPFVGAGIGFDHLTIGNFTDVNVNDDALGFSTNNSKSNFAWALHAGLAYQVTPNFTVELAYRYVDLGNGATKDLIAPDGSNPTFNPILFKHVTSNDLKLGVRWMFADTFFPEPPLIRKY